MYYYHLYNILNNVHLVESSYIFYIYLLLIYPPQAVNKYALSPLLFHNIIKTSNEKIISREMSKILHF